MAEPNPLALEAAADTDAALLLLTPRLTPRPMPDQDEATPLKCCCGSPECVFLRHNNSVLDSVEKDVHTAGRMGKVRLTICLLASARNVIQIDHHVDTLSPRGKGATAMNLAPPVSSAFLPLLLCLSCPFEAASGRDQFPASWA